LTISRLNCDYTRAALLLKAWIECGYKQRIEINPFRVLWINPNQITTSGGVTVQRDGRFSCHVLNGDWDLAEEQYEDANLLILLQEHFQYGGDWFDTSFYPKNLKNIEVREIAWNGCRSEIIILAKCAKLDQLFDAIKNTGYLIPDGLNYGETGLIEACVPHDIAVNIGRDGKFIFWDGRLWLSIAKILALPLIPVRVVIRPNHLQDFRDKIVLGRRKNNLSEYLQSQISHPNIYYLIA